MLFSFFWPFFGIGVGSTPLLIGQTTFRQFPAKTAADAGPSIAYCLPASERSRDPGSGVIVTRQASPRQVTWSKAGLNGRKSCDMPKDGNAGKGHC